MLWIGGASRSVRWHILLLLRFQILLLLLLLLLELLLLLLGGLLLLPRCSAAHIPTFHLLLGGCIGVLGLVWLPVLICLGWHVLGMLLLLLGELDIDELLDVARGRLLLVLTIVWVVVVLRCLLHLLLICMICHSLLVWRSRPTRSLWLSRILLLLLLLLQHLGRSRSSCNILLIELLLKHCIVLWMVRRLFHQDVLYHVQVVEVRLLGGRHTHILLLIVGHLVVHLLSVWRLHQLLHLIGLLVARPSHLVRHLHLLLLRLLHFVTAVVHALLLSTGRMWRHHLNHTCRMMHASSVLWVIALSSHHLGSILVNRLDFEDIILILLGIKEATWFVYDTWPRLRRSVRIEIFRKVSHAALLHHSF